MAEYVRLAKGNKSLVVVSQTWGEIHEINERIRLGLKKAGVIAKEEQTILAHERIDLTEAQKKDQRFYPANTVVVCNRDIGDFKRGQQGKFLKETATHLLVGSESRIWKIAFKHLECLTVCREVEMALAAGDRLQLKANGETCDGKPLVIGELVMIKKLDPTGHIHLQDGRILLNDFRQFVRGYAVTSYGSQGKTVEHVLFSDSANKVATNNQQWLVTISRGNSGIKIFTQDKLRLQESICRLGDRELAIELVQPFASKSNDLPPPVRKYIEGLIQTRRLAEHKPSERKSQWKQDFGPKMRIHKSRGPRI